MQENQTTERTPIMTVKIDPANIFTDVAVTDPNELSEIWTDSLAANLEVENSMPNDCPNSE